MQAILSHNEQAEANCAVAALFQGLEDLREEDRAVFFKEFGVSASEAEAYNKEHPAPAEQPSPPPAKKRKTVCICSLCPEQVPQSFIHSLDMHAR